MWERELEITERSDPQSMLCEMSINNATWRGILWWNHLEKPCVHQFVDFSASRIFSVPRVPVNSLAGRKVCSRQMLDWQMQSFHGESHGGACSLEPLWGVLTWKTRDHWKKKKKWTPSEHACCCLHYIIVCDLYSQSIRWLGNGVPSLQRRTLYP